MGSTAELIDSTAPGATSSDRKDKGPAAKLTCPIPEGDAAPEMEPMAICGMAMRLPGGIRDAHGYWDLLYNKRSGRCRVPKDRYNVDAWIGPGKIGHVAAEYGYFLDDVDLRNGDTSFWSMTKQEMEAMDRNSASHSSSPTSNVGVYLGTFDGDWLELDGRDPQHHHMYRVTGSSDYMPANRISYEFGFMGPSVTVRTACSSALVGLYDACNAIVAGDCDSAVVACANIIVSPRNSVKMAEHGVISPSGYCKTFDAEADGYARGEAVSAVYVKRLKDAIRDGDPVRSVIRAVCINAGGKAATLTSPNPAAHEMLMRRGHRLAGVIDLSKTAMIECHGTGTAVGDPLEAAAVANVFGEHGIYIGSVKPNLGHSEGASGLSSVIKMTLALEKQTIPPNINFKTPHPKIPFEECGLKVPTEPMPWPAGRSELVGVNSFGIGGSNAHVLLGSARSFGIEPVADKKASEHSLGGPMHQLMLFSAKHEQALREMVAQHQAYYISHPDSLPDMAYSLAKRREVLSNRCFCVTDGDDWIPSRTYRANNRSQPQIVFVFTGQGAQWPQMGQSLAENVAGFRADIEKMDGIIQALPDPPEWRLLDVILKPKASRRISEASLSQPCCTAIQIALINLLRANAISPAIVAGHSSGEIAAAYASEAISEADAIVIAYYRGKVMLDLNAAGIKGRMAAVSAGSDTIRAFLEDGVVVACENSPESTTISGDLEAVERTMETIKEKLPEASVRKLVVDQAYHSHHMNPVTPKYTNLLQSQLRAAAEPRVPFFSSVTGELIGPETGLDDGYWVKNLVSRVKFSTAISSILTSAKGPWVFLEIGPHAALAGPLRQIFQHEKATGEYISVLTRGQDSYQSFLKALGELWLQGVDITQGETFHRGSFLPDLPLYPWHYDGPLWAESRLSKEWRLRKFAHHEVLGSRVLESTDLSPSWRNLLRLDEVSWIKEHQVGGEVVFPATAFVFMAGEAIRQLTGSTSFTARQVHVKTACVLQQGQDTELITQLHRMPLTSALDSDWYEFDIQSYSQGTWVKHVCGKISAGSKRPRVAADLTPLPRLLSRKQWYRRMRDVGLQLGPRFMGLDDMSAHPIVRQARATMANSAAKHDGYAIHPASFDCLLQCLVPATFNGLTRRFSQLGLPTYMEEIYVQPPLDGQIRLEATADEISAAVLSGNVVAVSGGEVAAEIVGLQMTVVGDGQAGVDEDVYAAVELEWRRDLNLIDDLSSLISTSKDRTELYKMLDRFACACMLHAADQVGDVTASSTYLGQYQSWLSEIQSQIKRGEYPGDAAESFTDRNAGVEQRSALIDNLYAELKQTEASAAATAIHRVMCQSVDILSGEKNALEVLLEDDVLHSLYDFMQNSEYAQLVQLLAHRKPNLKILEIGAGTGGTTATVLPALKSAYGERMFSSYTYTDISPGFFPAARQRFQKYQGIEYSVLDISKDPASQGFVQGAFDLIIACNVLHATPVLHDTLRHVHWLLHPHGRLFLQEHSPATKWINFVMGTLSGWWLGEQDSRPLEPYITADRWKEALTAAGFGGIDAIHYDGYLNNNILSRPARARRRSKRITLLCSSKDPARAITVKNILQAHGFEVDDCLFEDGACAVVDGQDIVSILDLSHPFFHDLTEKQFEAFKDLLKNVSNKDSGILWITGTAQVDCTDPRYAMVNGVARVIRTEMNITFATLELQKFDDKSLEAVPQVLAEFQQRLEEEDVAPTTEWAHSKGETLISRYHFINVPESLRDTSSIKAESPTDTGSIKAESPTDTGSIKAESPTDTGSVKAESPKDTGRIKAMTGRKLEQHRPGLLDTLYWKPIDSGPELDDNEVLVSVKADVLISTGIITEAYSIGRGFGYEGSGLVVGLGKAVTKLAIGDRVILGYSGALSTVVQVDQRLCARMPEDMTFEQGATLPVVYSTAIHALMDVGRIYCTVGSEEKVKHLVEEYGIPRDRIFSSRNADFCDRIMQQTKGRGVDLVLNSLSGELLHASWACVAKFGTFIEIGRRDLVGRGRLDMANFEANRTFVGFDLLLLLNERKDMLERFLERCIELWQAGMIKAITPMHVSPAASVSNVLRSMQRGLHYGKMVVRMPEEALELPMERPMLQLKLRPDRAYLLVGGLGGLGRSLATWLVEHGARHLIFLSRSAGDMDDSDPFLQELAALACHTTRLSGDVAQYMDVVRAIKACPIAIAGVFQASMDNTLVDMSWPQWKATVQPKVSGTWNLHQALLSEQPTEPLDVFLLFSSAGAMSGQWGQANYNAGNTFLDAFVSYRHSLGLAASVLNIGPIEDVGYLSENSDVLDSLRSTSQYLMQEAQLLTSIELMLHRSQPQRGEEEEEECIFVNRSQVGIGMRSLLPITAPNNRTVWRKDPRMLIYRNIEHAFASGPLFLRDAAMNPNISKLQSAESAEMLARAIAQTMRGFSMMGSNSSSSSSSSGEGEDQEQINLNEPLSSIGLDSLIGIELRNWIRRYIGVETTVLEIYRAASVRELGVMVQAKLVDKVRAME
ncbi:hypothetical protein DV735_g512, partial [Chaetothyriales sp. CBS 134920]